MARLICSRWPMINAPPDVRVVEIKNIGFYFEVADFAVGDCLSLREVSGHNGKGDKAEASQTEKKALQI